MARSPALLKRPGRSPSSRIPIHLLIVPLRRRPPAGLGSLDAPARWHCRRPPQRLAQEGSRRMRSRTPLWYFPGPLSALSDGVDAANLACQPRTITHRQQKVQRHSTTAKKAQHNVSGERPGLNPASSDTHLPADSPLGPAAAGRRARLRLLQRWPSTSSGPLRVPFAALCCPPP
jgi:hypothetical protein